MTFAVRAAAPAESDENNTTLNSTASPTSKLSKNGSSSPSPTSKAPTTTYVQPNSYLPLTTMFSAPSSCYEKRMTMMVDWTYQMWINEPNPFGNQTLGECYPTEFMSSYRHITSTNSQGLNQGASIAHAMQGLVCPENWCTKFVGGADTDNYVACCPRDFNLHNMDPKLDGAPVVSNRPAYGATCYSDLTSGSIYDITKYDTKGSTNLEQFTASTSGQQVYAHVIDGFALHSSPDLGSCSAPSQTPSSTPTPKSTSPGTIAGATIGAISGLAFLISFIWLFLRWRHNRSKSQPKIDHVDHDRQRSIYEAEGSVASAEMGLSSEKTTYRRSAVNGGWGPFEMSGDIVHELDSGVTDKDGKTLTKVDTTDKKKSPFLDP